MKKIFILIIFLLSVFKLNAEVIYIQPVQNAKYVNIKNNIIVGFDDVIVSSNLNSLIKVDGTKSGRHSGEVIITSDSKSLLFIPDQPFYYSEIVNVNINSVMTGGKANKSFSYSFETEKERSNIQTYNSFTNEFENPDAKLIFNNFDGKGPANLKVTVSNNPSPGQLFMSNFPFAPIPFTPYIFTVNNRGSILSSTDVTSHLRAVDYKRQPNGLRTFFSYKNSKYYAMNDLNEIVDSFACGNGYITDQHEIKILNNGHVLLMSYDPQLIDMNVIVPGGNPNADVVGLIIQELDQNRNVVFQWRSWDHVEITEAIHENLNATVVDYVHGNAIELDTDGNILISSRHLSEISKISRSTGEFIWRLGGVHNEFTFPNDPIGFSYQHDIRRIENGNVTLYDNGNFHSPQFSRAVEYHLDEVNKVATLVWEYRHDPDLYGFAMGSVQRLKNGNTLISWGSANPTITEVTPDGNIALEMTLPDGFYTYRTFRDEINLTLNAELAIEGFYNPVTDKLNMSDTVRAYIRNSFSPFSIIDSAKSVIDSDNFKGNFRYYNVPDGTYYISIRHRNGLETWSRSGGESFTSGGVYEYDFTGSPANSFGNNVVLKGSKYCFYSGDVNQDGNINLADILLISNDGANYVTGYEDTDVNGDNITDLTDLVISYNNAKNFISKITP
ncbi:MAG: aryl-sulfate sulfotransferase [Ignavibacteria bacterium]